MRRRSGIALPLLAAVLLVALILAVTLGRTTQHSPSASSNPPVASGFDGAALAVGAPSHDFTLTDQHGRPVSLSGYRGQVVLITFLYSTCGASCIVIAQQIRGALDELPHPAPVLIISADPAADSPARVRRFLDEVSLTDRVEYLSGALPRLRSVWRAYRVTPASAGRAAFDRSASVMLLDGHGSERVLFGQEQLTPESLTHDIRKLQAG